MDRTSYQAWTSLDLRVGAIVEALPFPEAKQPAILLSIDFGALGVLKSSAQITDRYGPEDLQGRQIIAVVNFPPKQIAHHMSQCLVLGALSEEGVTLLQPDQKVPNGSKVE
jgi:tRNA-binding protein